MKGVIIIPTSATDFNAISSEMKELPPTYRLHTVSIVISVLLLLAIFLTTFWAAILASTSDHEITHQVILHLSSSNSFNILRVMIEVVNFLLGGLIAGSLEALLWHLAASKSGISLATLLTLSTTTGTGGLVTLGGWLKGGGFLLVLFRHLDF
jgi:hypothetical protein